MATEGTSRADSTLMMDSHRLSYTGSVLYAFIAGFQIFMFLRVLSVWSSIPRSHPSRKFKLPSVIIFGVLLVSFVVYTILNCVSVERELIAFDSGSLYYGMMILGDLSYAVSGGFLIYRCWSIYFARRWIIVLPSLVYLVYIAFAIFRWVFIFGGIYFNTYFVAWVVLLGVPAVGGLCNIITAILIFARLRELRRLNAQEYEKPSPSAEIRTLAPAHLNYYTSAASALIESAAPLALLGFGMIVVSILIVTHLEHNGITFGSSYFHLVWFPFVTLCPQWIAYRVVMGRSWANRAVSHPAGGLEK